MDSGGEVTGLMAETLIVLTGENAWSAARSFGSDAARYGDLSGAQYWRSVARAVLRQYAARLIGSAEESASPDAAQVAVEAAAETNAAPAAAPEMATADPVSADSWKNLGSAPIPMRARRSFPLHSTAPEDAPAKAVAEGNATEEMLLSRAA